MRGEMTGRVQLFQCSSALIFATLAAILEGIPRTGRRVVLISNHHRYPEVDDWFRADPRFKVLAEVLFDDVLYLNEHIFPTHPNRWKPAETELDRSWFDFDTVGELFVDSIQVPPARALVELCSRARIHVHSDGLMVYSPTRITLPRDVLNRIERVHFVDYLPGARPLLLEEARAHYESIEPSALRSFFDQVGAGTQSVSDGAVALFLGQAFEADRIMTLEDELALYANGLVALANEERIPSIAFKPHSRASTAMTRALASRFRRATGRELKIVAPELPLEAVLASNHVAAVVGVFSTALFTASRIFDIPSFKFCPKDVLYGLKPFANSNRIPLIATDIYLPSLYDLVTALRARPDESFEVVCRDAAGWDTERACADFREAQVAVGYHMQPQLLRHRKAEAERIVAENRVPCLDLYLRGAPTLAETRRRERRRMIDKALYSAMSPVLPERKARKLKRAPTAFFEDSKHLSMRALGQLYKVITR